VEIAILVAASVPAAVNLLVLSLMRRELTEAHRSVIVAESRVLDVLAETATGAELEAARASLSAALPKRRTRKPAVSS
jgi:hypothetical protein